MDAQFKVFRTRSTQRNRFQGLLRPHLEPLYRLAYRYTQCGADSEDLVRGVLACLASGLDESERPTPLRLWLVRKLCQRYAEVFGHDPKPGEFEHLPRSCEDISLSDRMNRSTLVGYTLMQSDLQRALLAALSDLDNAERDLVLLHDLEGYSGEEVAQILGIGPSEIAIRLHQGRARLQQVLECPDYAHRQEAQRAALLHCLAQLPLPQLSAQAADRILKQAWSQARTQKR